MKKNSALLVVSLACLGIYFWLKSKNKCSEVPADEPSSETVEVNVAETSEGPKMSMNASVTRPRFSDSLFNRDWVVR